MLSENRPSYQVNLTQPLLETQLLIDVDLIDTGVLHQNHFLINYFDILALKPNGKFTLHLCLTKKKTLFQQ